ncbi:MAG: 5-bromo-4-chloroindolyl phosphate hydrolysis family protein [Paracoccaceae bacterium]
MKLPDGVRQVVAGVLAGLVFLAAFQVLLLEWYVALGLGVVAYLALLLVIGRRTPLEEIVLSDRVSAADIARAGEMLEDAARRVGRVAVGADKEELLAMQGHLVSLRDQVLRDPADYRSAQRFIVSYLPKMVANVESYADLSKRATGAARDRLEPLRDGIVAYGKVVARIDQACLENDFNALEAEVDALAFQLKRG